MKKGDQDILRKLKQVTVILGILIGFCAMSMDNQWPKIPNQSIEESADDTDAGSAQFVKSIDAITYSTHISLEIHSILLEELPDVDVEKEETVLEGFVRDNASKALKILFRLIISPNAP